MWTYDSSDLNVNTSSGRLNSVRLLVGDTDTTDQQVQNEEINFSLSQSSDSIYSAASWICRVISAKYSRLVTTQLDGVLQAEYNDLASKYTSLATQIEVLGKKTSGKALGVFAGGISSSDAYAVEQDADRVKPAFVLGQFDNPNYVPTDGLGY
jgi:hypothetical protein